MKVEIVILVIFIACHLVKSNVTSRLNKADDGGNKVHETTTERGNAGACIINCYLTKKPRDEKCNAKQLKNKCKTLHKRCRCLVIIN